MWHVCDVFMRKPPSRSKAGTLPAPSEKIPPSPGRSGAGASPALAPGT